MIEKVFIDSDIILDVATGREPFVYDSRRVLSIIEEGIIQALDSGFGDFEDAVQYYSALTNQCTYIVTRNINDYKKSDIPVVEPKEFVALFEGFE